MELNTAPQDRKIKGHLSAKDRERVKDILSDTSLFKSIIPEELENDDNFTYYTIPSYEDFAFAIPSYNDFSNNATPQDTVQGKDVVALAILKEIDSSNSLFLSDSIEVIVIKATLKSDLSILFADNHPYFTREAVHSQVFGVFSNDEKDIIYYERNKYENLNLEKFETIGCLDIDKDTELIISKYQGNWPLNE